MFGFLRRRSESEDPHPTLSGRIGDLESEVRRLRTEWLDTLERLERLMGRLSKRAQRAEAASDPGPETEAQQPMDEVTYRRSVKRFPGRL